MSDTKTIDDELEALWAQVSDGMQDTAPAAYLDIRGAIVAAEQTVTDTSDKLQPWLTISERGIATLFGVHQLAIEIRAGTEHSTAFMFQVGRACSYAVAIRKLVLAGQEDAARVVFRSFLENLDIGIVALDDSELAKRLDIGGDSENLVWREEIARGKIRKRAAAVAARAGVDDPDWCSRRRDDNALLSGSVHSSARSAFRSSAVFSLAHPGAIVLTPLGHPSVDMPILLYRLAEDVHAFAAIVLKLVMHSAPPALLAGTNVRDAKWLPNAFAEFMLLQEVLAAYEDRIVAYEEQRQRWLQHPE